MMVFAHPGKTDSDGCHICKTNCEKWGLRVGEYHCEQNKRILKIEARKSAPNNLKGTICSYNAYNCSDFLDSSYAQAVFEYCGVKYDIHDLDRDKDGLACESL
jgi:hypothetical protein